MNSRKYLSLQGCGRNWRERRKHSINNCKMQKVLRVVPPISRRQKQLILFVRPQIYPRWIDLSHDVQQKIMPLLAQLLRQHRRIAAESEIAQELCDE